MTTLEVLSKYFGYDSFRPGQEEIINSILAGKSVLAVLPTGAGKSICYQIPALCTDGFSIVISPLIALMKDQVDSLNKKSNIASFINSTLGFSETEEALNKISFGETKLLYVAPERLSNKNFVDRLAKLNPSFLFIDEAHCISEWGHSFRPSYRKISEFIEYLGIKKISAFTATATPEVITDIVEQLHLSKPEIFVNGFERDNLSVTILITKKRRARTLELLTQNETPAIIYTASRKNAEDVASYLVNNRIDAVYYHAGLQPEERRHIQESFIKGRNPVIVATNAFGMGIDKKDIRLIIHYNSPGSIENYYQEIGRAGRDGKEAKAILLFDEYDVSIHKYFINSAYPDKEFIIEVYNALCDYGRIAVGNINTKEIAVEYDYLTAATKRKVTSGLVHSALNILHESGYIKVISELEKKSYLRFTLDIKKLKEYTKNIQNKLLKELILLLLREFGSTLFNKNTPFSLQDFANKVDLDEYLIEENLMLLNSIGIIEYTKPAGKESIMLTLPRVETHRLIINHKRLSENYLHAQSKLESMLELIHTSECRFKFILRYFGDKSGNYQCGKCDNCLKEETLPEQTIEYLREIILRTIAESSNKFSESELIKGLTAKSRAAKIKSLPNYGTLAHYKQEEISTVVEHLSSKKIIQKNSNDGRYISLTKKGETICRNAGFLKVNIKDSHTYTYNIELYNLLREARKGASKKFSQTGYLICPDETLREIAEKKPQTRGELLQVKGFNNRMFNKLGEDFLEIIKDYSSKLEKEKSNDSDIKTLPTNINDTLKLIHKGYSLKDIASLRKLTEAVVSMQVETILDYYPDTKIEDLISAEILKIIESEIKIGFIDLKELKERLPEEISYPQIRIVVAKLKAANDV